MTMQERKERNRLHLLWATGKATPKQIKRCMDLDRKARYEAREAEELMKDLREIKSKTRID